MLLCLCGASLDMFTRLFFSRMATNGNKQHLLLQHAMDTSILQYTASDTCRISVIFYLCKYSKPPVARTLMARLSRLIRTRSLESFRKNPIAADLGYFRVIFFFILIMVYCVDSLQLPRWGDSNENTQHTLI